METALPLPVLPLLLPVLLVLLLPLPPPLLLPLLPRAAAEQGEPGGAVAPAGAPAPPGSSALPRSRPRRVRGAPAPRCPPCPAASARGVAASAPTLVARGRSGCALRYRERSARLGGGIAPGLAGRVVGRMCRRSPGRGDLPEERERTDGSSWSGRVSPGCPGPRHHRRHEAARCRYRDRETVRALGPCPWRLRCHGRIPLIPAGRVSHSIPERIVRDVPAWDEPPHPLLPASEPEAQPALPVGGCLLVVEGSCSCELREIALPVKDRIGCFLEKGGRLSGKSLFQSSCWYLSVPASARRGAWYSGSVVCGVRGIVPGTAEWLEY